MKIDKSDIEKIEDVGTADDDCDVIHVLTKGGLSVVALKKKDGSMNILGSGPLFGIAKFRAEQGYHKHINWNESLFKSEDMQAYQTLHKQLNIQDLPDASTPANHYKMAAYNSKLAAQARDIQPKNEQERFERGNQIIMHTDSALKHYKIAGLDPKSANAEHTKNMINQHEIDDKEIPNQERIEQNWKLQNPQLVVPSGIDTIKKK